MSKVLLYTNEISKFKRLVIDLMMFERPEEVEENIQEKEKHQFAADLAKLGKHTMRNNYSKKKFVFLFDNFRHFCEGYHEKYLSISKREDRSDNELYKRFTAWFKGICARKQWEITLKEFDIKSYVSKANIEQEIDIILKEYDQVEKVLQAYFSLDIISVDDKSWDLLSLSHKNEYYSHGIGKAKPFRRIATRNVVAFNFNHKNRRIVNCDIFFELNVHDHISYSMYLYYLRDIGEEDQLQHHIAALLQLVNLRYSEKIKEGKSEEAQKWFDKENDVEYISIENIFELFQLDYNNLHELLPLTKNCYIKTSAFCSCVFEDNSWRVAKIVPQNHTISSYYYCIMVNRIDLDASSN